MSDPPRLASGSSFRIVYKAIHGMHLEQEEVEENQALLDYHLLQTPYLLIRTAKESFALHDDSGIKTRSKAKAATVAPTNPPLIDERLIVCATEECAQAVSQIAKQQNLPYCPFQILFCEGQTMSMRDGMELKCR